MGHYHVQHGTAPGGGKEGGVKSSLGCFLLPERLSAAGFLDRFLVFLDGFIGGFVMFFNDVL